MSLADQIYEEFLREKAIRLKLPRSRLAIIRRLSSGETLDAAGLGSGVRLGRGFSNKRLFEAFYAVERDRNGTESSDIMQARRHTVPAWVCDEAANILHALGRLESDRSPKTRTDSGVASFGRVCAYCWRTEPRPRKVGLYGKCHIHVELLPPPAGESELDEQRRARLTPRNESDKARRLLAAAPPGTLEGSNYPVLPRRPQMPNLSEIDWREFVESHFPLSAEFALGVSDDALMAFMNTVVALEGRPLTLHEVSELTEPFWALPRLLRCEAWLGLKDILFRKCGKGR